MKKKRKLIDIHNHIATYMWENVRRSATKLSRDYTDKYLERYNTLSGISNSITVVHGDIDIRRRQRHDD